MKKLLAMFVVVTAAACNGPADDGDDVADPIDAAQISACSDIDATGLTSATIDELVATYNGQPCTAPLEGGIASLMHECGYGASLTVCGQSSGLSQFGCACNGGHLACSNGEAIKEGQERLCGDAGVD